MTIRTDKSSLLWAPELQYGVPQSTNYRRFGLHDSAFLPDPEYNWMYYYNTLKSTRGNVFRGPEKLEGNISDIRLQGTEFLHFLTSPSGDYFISPFTLVAAMYDNTGNINFSRVYTGGKVNRASIHIREGEELQLSIDSMMFIQMFHNRPNGAGARFSNFYPIDPGPLNTTRYIYDDITFIFAGVAMGRIRALDISIDNGLVPYYALQQGASFDQIQSPLKLLIGQTSYTASITVDMVDNTDLAFWDYLSNQVSNPSDVMLTGNGFTLVCSRPEPAGSASLILNCGTTSTNRGLVFSKVEYPMSVSDRGYYSAVFTGNFDTFSIQEL